MQPTTTLDLLQRAQQGAEDALSLLFERYRRRLAVLIRYKMGAESRAKFDADDLVQETLLRAYRDLPQFTYRSPGSFMHWLSAIADHAIADAVRYAARLRRKGNEVGFRSESNPAGPEPADTLTPSRVLVQEERLQALLAKLDALPEHYREVLLLAKIEGLTTEEISVRMGKSRETVSLLLFRALKRLGELLERGKAVDIKSSGMGSAQARR
jgi:RNA polymerase sigma-70 factor, ECF subfamily